MVSSYNTTPTPSTSTPSHHSPAFDSQYSSPMTSSSTPSIPTSSSSSTYSTIPSTNNKESESTKSHVSNKPYKLSSSPSSSRYSSLSSTSTSTSSMPSIVAIGVAILCILFTSSRVRRRFHSLLPGRQYTVSSKKDHVTSTNGGNDDVNVNDATDANRNDTTKSTPSFQPQQNLDWNIHADAHPPQFYQDDVDMDNDIHIIDDDDDDDYHEIFPQLPSFSLSFLSHVLPTQWIQSTKQQLYLWYQQVWYFTCDVTYISMQWVQDLALWEWIMTLVHVVIVPSSSTSSSSASVSSIPSSPTRGASGTGSSRNGPKSAMGFRRKVTSFRNRGISTLKRGVNGVGGVASGGVNRMKHHANGDGGGGLFGQALPELEHVEHVEVDPCDAVASGAVSAKSTGSSSMQQSHETNESKKDQSSQPYAQYNTNIPPAFLREEDYPKDWLVYDPLRGVIRRNELIASQVKVC